MSVISEGKRIAFPSSMNSSGAVLDPRILRKQYNWEW